MEAIVLKELLPKQKQYNIKVRVNNLEIMRLVLKVNKQNQNQIVLRNNLKRLKMNHNKRANKNKIIRTSKLAKLKKNNPNHQKKNNINILKHIEII